MLEAASCCLPSICYENNGISEIINHKKNGYIAKLNDVDDFITGVNWIINNLDKSVMENQLQKS